MLAVVNTSPKVLANLPRYIVKKLCFDHSDLLLGLVMEDTSLALFCSYCEEKLLDSFVELKKYQKQDDTLIMETPLKDELEKIVGETSLHYATGSLIEEEIKRKFIENGHSLICRDGVPGSFPTNRS